ncbi:MAG: glycosyltransferase family 4 protein [Bacillota bacterium]
MVRLCHLTSVHPQTDTRIFYKECKTIAAAGYDVSLIVQHKKDEVMEGIQIFGLAKSDNRKERMTKTAREVYERALYDNADIYHFHDPELIPVALKLKRKGKKVIYDVHEDVPRQILSKHWIAAPLRKPLSWTIERIENYAAKKFDYIITATPFIKERFLRLNKNAIDINNYPILSELHVPNVNWDEKEKLVCYVGGIGQVRGIYEIVEAIGMTKYSLLLAGTFSSKAEYDSASNKSGWAKVIELGYLNRDEVRGVLSKSMAGLVVLHPIPNYIDALPVKMFEYMSAGIPVIASNFPLWKEIIEGNNCGICVDPLNAREIADAINRIMDNPYQAQKMGENGRKAVEEKYNWEKEGKKLIKIYEELLS